MPPPVVLMSAKFSARNGHLPECQETKSGPVISVSGELPLFKTFYHAKQKAQGPYSLGVAADGGGLPGRVGAGGVCLVQGGLALAIKAHHKRGDAKRPRSAALRVLLLDVGDPPGQVVHLAPPHGQ